MNSDFPDRFTKLSEIVQYLRCPRKVYFTSRTQDRWAINQTYLQHLLLKEFSYCYSELLQKAQDELQLTALMQSRLHEVGYDIIHIYAAEFGQLHETGMQDSIGKISESLGEIASNLTAYCNEYGRKLAIEQISPVEIEPVLSHEKLRLTGKLPATIRLGDTLSPMLIKTGNSPEKGIWKTDRIHLAASVFLCEEYTGMPVYEGIVEYAASGKIRKVRIHTTERRSAINVIKRIEKIKEGRMPEKKEGPLCESCEFRESCISKPTSLASRLF
jgi:CRISPR-associated exonuclease Cas4